MALTKIGSIGINTGIQFAGVTTIATLNGSDSVLSVGGTVNFVSDVSIGGTVSIAGTLTYEDVTNIDAVGLITARNGVVVGSGITLSKDGDIFATGVTTTGSLVSNGAISGAKITLPDSAAGSLNVGLGSDLQVYHTGTHSFIENKVGNLRFKNDGTYKGAQFEVDLIDFNTSDNSVVHMRKEPKGNINITKNLNVVGTSTCNSILIDRGSGSDTALIVNTTSTSNACRIVFNESDARKAELTYSHDNDRLELIAMSGNAVSVFTDGYSGERLRITTRGDIAFNRVGMSTAIGDNSDGTGSTADPKRFVFNSDYSSGYTDASLKLYLFNRNETRHGFTSGPSHDLQYHVSGSNPANTNLSISKHTFFKENKKIFQLGYKSGTGENVIGHVGLTTGTSKLAWGNPVSEDYRLGTSGGAALVFGVDGDSEFFGVDGHWTGQRHAEYMRISKEGYMTKPYQPSFLVAAGRAGDGYTDSPYQFRTAVRNVDSAFKMGSGTGQYSYYYVPITGLYLFTTHAAYQQSGVSFNTRIHRYNSAGAVQEVLELHRNVGFSGSHAGGAGSCMMYCTAGDYVYVAPDYTPYHLNTTLNFFAGCLLG